MEHITIEQAQKLVDLHVHKNKLTILDVQQVQERSRSSRVSRVKTYHLNHSSTLYLDQIVLKVETSSKEPATTPSYAENTLAIEYALLAHLHTNKSTYPLHLPLPTHLGYMDEKNPNNPVAPHAYLLLSHPRGLIHTPSTAHSQHSPIQKARLDLLLGTFFRSFHAVDQEYYGRHDTPEPERILEWEEQFLLLLDEVLEDASRIVSTFSSGKSSPEFTIPVENIRSLLAKAIGSYLFDGVEWPHLVADPIDEPLFVISDPFSHSQEEDVDVLCMFPYGLPRTFWADPAFESALREPVPSEHFITGYTDGHPESWKPLPRDHTKVLWYRLYSALVQIIGAEGETEEELMERVRAVHACVGLLKEAPCY